MINFIKKKFQVAIYKFIFRYQHIYNPKFNTAFKDIHAQSEINFDLLSKLHIDENNYSKNSLISCIDRKDFYLKLKNNYIFESWVLNNNKTYTDNYNFQNSHRRKILKNLNFKDFRYYHKKIFIFPYYTNQFGHFISENLGGILFFLNFFKERKKKEKLLIIAPSKKWETFFKQKYKDNCIFFSNNFFTQKNIVFTKSQILPKFNPFQNYMISKNIISSKIENTEYRKKRVFLTSEREEKIANIKELISFLKKKRFLILNPKNVSIEKLLKILNSAKIVISEFASISHNIHISRNKPYYLLMSTNDQNINYKWYRLTHYYKNFHTRLFKPIYSDTVGDKKFIPYQSQIIVDIKKLKNIFN